MELALAHMLARVVDVEEDHGRQGHAVHDACRGHQGSQPPAAVGLFIITVKQGKIKILISKNCMGRRGVVG